MVRIIFIGIDVGEVLILMVSDDGKLFLDDEVIVLYEKIGKYFGIFDNFDDVIVYVEKLYEQ